MYLRKKKQIAWYNNDDYENKNNIYNIKYTLQTLLLF